jgi:8-oxo-dGTP diphosphatase
MPLAWTGAPRWSQDGFHEGVRVAGVQRCSEPIGDTLARVRYWMAFVRTPGFEFVLVDGEPGRWKTDGEAREAAERAFAAWLVEGGDLAGLALADASCPPKPLTWGKHLRIGTKALLSAAMASWWPFPRGRHGAQHGRAGVRQHGDLVVHDCVMAILRDGDTVVMCHRHPDREWVPNVWDFPGGHVEDQETPQQALARELAEELGVIVDAPSRPADEVLTFEEQSVRLSVWFIDYSGPIENRCPEEHDDVRWVALDVASQLELADAAYVPLLRRALHIPPPTRR